MKTLLVMTATLGIAAGAFAQGKVTIINDNSHLLKYSSSTADLRPADAALAGASVASPSGINASWAMQLYGNPSATATQGMLAALGTWANAGGPVAGRFSGVALTLPTGYPGGPVAATVPASFQVRLWEKTANNYTSFEAAKASGLAYYAMTPVFTMNPGPASANSIVAGGTPSFSTWAAGDIVALVPEPASASIIGLGLASLLIFRRRK